MRARILIIDDDAALGRALGRALSLEHTPVIETDARAALARLADEHFDVVLCDLMMPLMSGVEFYEALARSDAAAARRVVFMTGGAFTARGSEFLDAVPNVILAKPFDVADMMAVIAVLME